MLSGIKVKAINIKTKTEHIFNSLGEAVKFMEETFKSDKKHYARSIKACFSGYQESAYGYKFIKLDSDDASTSTNHN